MADIISKITSDDIKESQTRAIALPLSVLQEAAIPSLISLLKDERKETREAVADALAIIGSKSSSMLKDFFA